MSDLVSAAKAATLIKDRIKLAEGLAQTGTQSHWQIVSAALMAEWPRIRFCLDVLEKERVS